MMELVIGLIIALVILVMAVLGHFTAVGLERVARDWKEYREKRDKESR